MLFAIQTPPEHTDFGPLRDLWVAADELGLWGAFTFDHLVPLNDRRPGGPDANEAPPPGPQFEGWTALTALAMHTRQLQVGTLTTGITYRHPVMLAKMAVTLDRATSGRAILGVGAAWHQVEHAMYGIPFPSVGDRMGRLDETLRAFRLLCSQERTTFHGRHVQVTDAVFEPKPVRPTGIPILVGGGGQRLKRIAARHADLFNGFPPPWEWRGVNEDLDAKLRAVGRDPSEQVRSAFVFTELSGDPSREDALVGRIRRTRGGTEDEVRRRILAGSPGHMISVVQSYEEAGISLLVMNVRAPFGTAGLERFAREVMPDFT